MFPGITDWEKERRLAPLWPVYVRRGCLLCGQTDRWCPDCHTCTRCGKGCDECHSIRSHPRISPQNRGGKRGNP